MSDSVIRRYLGYGVNAEALLVNGALELRLVVDRGGDTHFIHVTRDEIVAAGRLWDDAVQMLMDRHKKVD